MGWSASVDWAIDRDERQPPRGSAAVGPLDDQTEAQARERIENIERLRPNQKFARTGFRDTIDFLQQVVEPWTPQNINTSTGQVDRHVGEVFVNTLRRDGSVEGRQPGREPFKIMGGPSFWFR